jgi:hypothetical protein
VPLTPEQRAAQRSLVGFVRAGYGVFLDEQRGFCIWRGTTAQASGVGINEVTGHLDVLEVPYTVAVETMTVRRREQAGFAAQVARADLPALVRWVPSLQKSIDAAEHAWGSAVS